MKHFSIDLKSTVIMTMISMAVISGFSSVKAQTEDSSYQSNYQSSQSSHYQSTQSQGIVHSQSSLSYCYPPYQISLDSPIQIQYHSPNAQSVVLNTQNLTTHQKFSYPLTFSKNSQLWVGQIPASDFNRSQELEMTFKPMDGAGNVLEEQVQSIRYVTLNTPGYYKTANTSHPEMRIVAFQRDSLSSPVFDVYWPELYYTKQQSYPLAARVTSSHSPENSIRKLDPIQDKPGWFELKVSTLWFSPGEDITVEFSSKDTQKSNPNPNYSVGSNKDFVSQKTIQFKTLPN